jgi:hypothetical protein
MRVLPIKYEETKDWLLNVHYLKRMPVISYAFGLFEDSDCLGIVTFGLPASPSLCKGICGDEWSSKVIELNRMCFREQVKNGNSYLISQAMKFIPKPMIVVSYADTKFGHLGKVYQASNFIYTGITKERTDGSPKKEGSHSRHDVDYTKRVDRSAKHRYVFISANKSDRKKILNALNYKVQPYPQGTPSRYDINHKPITQGTLL